MILVTGATGYVGRHVVKALCNAGENVRCLIHNNKDVRNFCDVEMVKGDITDPVSMAVACTGVDTVIHLVSIIREKKGTTFEVINVKGTESLIKAAKESGAARFIYMSALGASNNPKLKYAYSKGLAERAVIDSGLKYTILRPSVIFGPGEGFVDRMLQALRMTPTVVALPGDGSTKFQPVSVKDVARCVATIVQQPNRYKNKSLDIGGPEHLTYEQMLDILMECTNIKKSKVHIPMPMVKVAAVIMQWLMTDPPVTIGELSQLAFDNTTEIDSIKKNFGFEPVNYAEGLEYIRYKIKNNKNDINPDFKS